jgi:hypothetical protein
VAAQRLHPHDRRRERSEQSLSADRIRRPDRRSQAKRSVASVRLSVTASAAAGHGQGTPAHERRHNSQVPLFAARVGGRLDAEVRRVVFFAIHPLESGLRANAFGLAGPKQSGH